MGGGVIGDGRGNTQWLYSVGMHWLLIPFTHLGRQLVGWERLEALLGLHIMEPAGG